MNILNSINIKNHNIITEINNYNEKFNTNINNCSIDINKNLNLMSESEKNILIKKYLTENQKNNIILEYELLNYNPPKYTYTMKKFKSIVQYLFDRYTYKVGGYYFDTNKWIDRKINTSKYFIFQNTIHVDYIHDMDTKKYLSNMVNLFNRISNNFSVYVDPKFIYRDNIYYLFIIFIQNK
jgi:hypothetical protein